MRRIELIAFSAIAALTGAANAQVTTLTQAGYTGLGITPNAHLIDWGRAEFTYDNQLPGVVSNPHGRNYVLGFGLLPNLEIAGRLATNTLTCDMFTSSNCGIRDLSASAKAGIGLDAAHRFSIAAGVTDVGGAATNFRTYYGVLTFDQRPFQASAGLAKRRVGNAKISLAPLEGPFAAASWQPLPWIRGQLEYTDGNSWAGVRLFAPQAWLPEGWTAYIGSNHRLNKNNLTQPGWFTAGLSIPLYKVPSLPQSGPKAPLPPLSTGEHRLPAYEARVLPAPAPAATSPTQAQLAAAPAGSAPATTSVAAPKPAARPLTDSDLEALAAALEAKGLEDISVGRLPDGSVAVRANNAAYNWNSVDALGAALGAVARSLGDTNAAYRLVLTQRQVPLVAVAGRTGCLREWIQNSNAACMAGQLSTPGAGALEPMLSGAIWLVSHRKPSTSVVHVTVSPVLRTSIGTEVGAFDYSLGANVGLRVPVWAGASVDVRRDVPLSNSRNYEANQAFSATRVRSETERIALTQTVRVPLERWLAPGNDAAAMRWGLTAVTGQATVGRVGGSFDGAEAAVRWEPGEGRHRLSADTGYFRNARFDPLSTSFGPRDARPFLASYRYNVTATRTFFEATGGQFFYNDRGIQFGLRQWFSDVALSAYYRRTRFENSPVRQFIGLELSIPIGPRRDVALGRHVEVGGTPRFSHAVETIIRGGFNAVRPGFGLTSPAPDLDETFNSDRTSLVYFEDNIRRIRDAAR